jgi:hypothetical protein
MSSRVNYQATQIDRLVVPNGSNLLGKPDTIKGSMGYDVTDDTIYISNGSNFISVGGGGGGSANNYTVAQPVDGNDINGIKVDNTFNVITMELANETSPGLLSTQSQTIAGSKSLTSPVFMNGGGTVSAGQVLSIIDQPNADESATNKKYVDNLFAQGGVSPLLNANAATTTILPDTPVYNSAAGTLSAVGIVLTLTIDGISIVAGDSQRIVVKNQVDPRQNGIFTRTVDATGWVLTRTSDFDTAPAETIVNRSIFCTAGSLNVNTGWVLFQAVVQFNPELATPGSSDVIWIQASGSQNIQAGSGMSQTGNTFNINGTAGRISIGSTSVNIDTSYVGQTSINTLGTVSTGVWNGSIVQPAYGGSGLVSPTANNVLISNGLTAYTLKANPASAFVGTSDNQNLSNKTINDSTNVVTATALFSGGSTNTVNVGLATPPIAGQVLTAMSSTAAAWVTPIEPADWSLTGNTGTDPNSQFIGCTDNKQVTIATNGPSLVNRLIINNNSRIEPVNGKECTFFGQEAGSAGGLQDTFVGRGAGSKITTSSNNVGVGYVTLNNLTNGAGNASLGSLSLGNLLTGSNNVSVGYNSMKIATTSSGNSAVGVDSGSALTTGTFNSLVGLNAGIGIKTGSFNCCLGLDAGGFLGGELGNQNLFLGTNAGKNINSVSASFNIMINNQGVLGDNGVIRIGTSGQSKNFQQGIRGIAPDVNDGLIVFISSTGQLTTTGVVPPPAYERFVFNTNLTGAITNATSIILTKYSTNVVTIDFEGESATGINGSPSINIPAIPVQFRPTVANRQFSLPIFDGNPTPNDVGILTITLAGTVSITTRDGTNFLSGVMGYVGTSVTYTV